MSKVLFLLANVESRHAVCVLRQVVRATGSPGLASAFLFTLRPLPGNQICVLRRLQCPLVRYP